MIVRLDSSDFINNCQYFLFINFSFSVVDKNLLKEFILKFSTYLNQHNSLVDIRIKFNLIKK